jgi:oligopeptide/dipeptide ABC transporter ATP-binding protein
MSDRAPLLEVEHLSVTFPGDGVPVHALDDVSLTLGEHEVLGVVGESGSGKTTLALALLGLLPADARVDGVIRFRGTDLVGLGDRELRPLRGDRIAIVFQDAPAVFNPVMTVGAQVAEAIAVHHAVGDAELRERVVALLDLVGIPDARRRAGQLPHEYSGGMRQRAMIAMAIANDPDVLVADEPTTALDVTVQAQVLDVLERVQERTRSSTVLVTHDLGVVAGIAQRVMVMYAGRQAEVAPVDDVFHASRHPYTLGLLASLPRLDDAGARHGRLHRIAGQPPSLAHVPAGCPFHPRCPVARVPGRCDGERPALRDVGSGHASACHFAETLDVVPLTEPERARS